jgi:hypothetical protein
VDHTFDAELWLWDARPDSWTFLTVPREVSEAIADETPAPPAGFGSIKVEVRIGETSWRTSVFPDAKSGCYVLPVKKAVRKAEDLETGDIATVHLAVAPA